MDLTIVIPMHDEEEALQDLLPALESFQRREGARLGMEVILVDDGSGDRTLSLALDWAERVHFPAKVLGLRPQEGIGGALRAGFRFAGGRWVCTYDADQSYPLDDVLKLLEAAEQGSGADVVTASPFRPGSGAKSAVGLGRLSLSRLATLAYRLRLGRRAEGLSCFTCGFRLYRRELLPRIGHRHDGFLATAEILCHAIRAGLRIAEVPSPLGPRTRGRSKMKVLRTALSHLKFLLRLR